MIYLYEKMLPDPAGIKPATSWSPVGRASTWATEVALIQIQLIVCGTPCENMSASICGQRRPRSVSAAAQSDHSLRCPRTESLVTRMYQWTANARKRLCACVGWIWNGVFLRMLEDTFSIGAIHIWFEPAHDQTYNKSSATSEDSDQTAHTRSLIWVFTGRMCVFSLKPIQRRINENPCHKSELSLCWLHRSYCRVFLVFFFFPFFFFFLVTFQSA